MDEGTLRLSTGDGIAHSYRRLAEVFRDVLSEQNLDALLDRLADTLAELVSYDALTIYRADDTARVLVPVLARDRWATQILDSSIGYGVGLTGLAAERREPLLVQAVHLDPRAELVPGTPEDEPEALISVPLVARGRLKGALNVYRLGETASFTHEEFEIAERFADAAALALDNAETHARLEHQAQTDSLTGLFNHRVFHERLRAELARTSRGRGPVAVLMLDVDDFKRVNDIHGHATGDQALVRVAELLASTVRDSDVACRLGGEEFGVVMPDGDMEAATSLAHRFRDLLAATVLDHVGYLSVSTGIAVAPDHAMNPRELTACAEAAMMAAKASGKRHIVVFGDEASDRPDQGPGSDRDARSIAHLKMLQGLVGKLNRLNDVNEIGMLIVTELRTLVDYHTVRVYLADDGELVPIAYGGDLDDCGDEPAEVLRCEIGEGITGHAAATGQSLLVSNAVDCDFAVQIPGTPIIDESIIAVPLCYAARTIGVVVISKLGVDQFDEADVRLLEVLAGHASVALENARLYAAARREADRARESAEVARALLSLSRVLATARSLEDVLDRLAATTVRILGTTRASIWLEEPGDAHLRLGAEYGYDPSERERLESLGFDAVSVRRLTDVDRPVVIEGRALHGGGGRLAGADGGLAIALFRLDAIRIGLLATPWPDKPEAQLTDRAMRLLAGIADQATLAIGNAGHFESLEQTFLSTVEALASALEANDDYVSSHATALTASAVRVGTELGLDAKALKRLELGALFHDIGKIGIPSEILRKPGPLTTSERAAIELDPTLGERILDPIDRLAEIRPVVRHCRERWDGSGYPEGLAREAIPLESRIIFVCDTYHAMTTDRPYRSRLSHADACRQLEAEAGAQFDPRVVAAFLATADASGQVAKAS
jgi:diguanylate cyclase (GGDEF)-like protein